MNKKNKPNKTTFNRETLEPTIIDIGNIENNITGALVFNLFIFYLNFMHIILLDLCTVNSFVFNTDSFSNIV